jgi:hypothetical protein
VFFIVGLLTTYATGFAVLTNGRWGFYAFVQTLGCSLDNCMIGFTSESEQSKVLIRIQSFKETLCLVMIRDSKLTV